MSTSFSNILAGSVCQVDGVLVGETWLVLDTHKILCTLAVFSSSKLLALTEHILHTFANRNLQLYVKVENGAAGWSLKLECVSGPFCSLWYGGQASNAVETQRVAMQHQVHTVAAMLRVEAALASVVSTSQ